MSERSNWHLAYIPDLRCIVRTSQRKWKFWGPIEYELLWEFLQTDPSFAKYGTKENFYARSASEEYWGKFYLKGEESNVAADWDEEIKSAVYAKAA